jgi:hypothetical protein
MAPTIAAVPTTAAIAGVPKPVSPASASRRSPAKRNCVVSPHTCGYPDATNTGVPASVHLLSVPGQVSFGPGWEYDSSGYVEVYGNGAVLSGLYIPCNLDISASDVTITDDEIVTTGTGDFGISLRHTAGVTVSHSDISSPDNTGPRRLQYGIKDIYADSTATVLNANNIWNTSTAIAISEGTVENNYIHAFGYDAGDHDDGIASDAGSPDGLSIIHNTILNPLDQTDAIQLSQGFGPQMDATISGNLLAGGGYTVYAGDSGPATPTSIVITNNRFARLYNPGSGAFGPAAYVATGPGDTWAGNIWDDTLKPINEGLFCGARCPAGGPAVSRVLRFDDARGLDAQGWNRPTNYLGFRRTLGSRWWHAPCNGDCDIFLCPYPLGRSTKIASHQEQ